MCSKRVASAVCPCGGGGGPHCGLSTLDLKLETLDPVDEVVSSQLVIDSPQSFRIQLMIHKKSSGDGSCLGTLWCLCPAVPVAHAFLCAYVKTQPLNHFSATRKK